MNDSQRTRISRTLSYVLRHRPDAIGIELDAGGWVKVDRLLEALAASGKPVTRHELADVVSTNTKNRFELSGDGERIRARQGHSVPVELGYEPQAPPHVLYHGTAAQYVESILKTGLHRAKRHHVHLSTDRETMLAVGSRRGKAVLIEVDARAMHAAGHRFYRTGNNVWLTESVPAKCLRVAREPASRSPSAREQE